MDKVQDLFKDNPILGKIGTPEQYREYLNTIFPNSKIKDIVYHSSFSGLIGKIKNRAYFSTDKEYARNVIGFPRDVKAYIIDINNPYYTDLPIAAVPEFASDKYFNPVWKIGKNDSVIGKDYGQEQGETIVVLEGGEIYKLGSEEDIRNFKKFTSQNKKNMNFSKIFTKDWWIESLQLNEEEVSNAEVIRRIIKAFKLVPFKQGFGNAYTTKNSRATTGLYERIVKWAKENFPNHKVKIRFERTFKTINLDIPESLRESINDRKQTINEFIKYAVKELDINTSPKVIVLSKDQEKAQERSSFGSFDPNTNEIWIYIGNRNMADILRTLAHELIHHKQREDNQLQPDSGETGSEIENEANAKAGILLRDYGKDNKNIYESKK